VSSHEALGLEATLVVATHLYSAPEEALASLAADDPVVAPEERPTDGHLLTHGTLHTWRRRIGKDRQSGLRVHTYKC